VKTREFDLEREKVNKQGEELARLIQTAELIELLFSGAESRKCSCNARLFLRYLKRFAVRRRSGTIGHNQGVD